MKKLLYGIITGLLMVSGIFLLKGELSNQAIYGILLIALSVNA